MNVFLTEPNTRYDLKALESYGPIKLLSKNHLNPFNTNLCLEILKEGLKDFDSTEDYLCMTGNLLSVSMMMMIAYSMFDTFRVLVFDARTSNYKERIIIHV